MSGFTEDGEGGQIQKRVNKKGEGIVSRKVADSYTGWVLVCCFECMY